MVSLINLFLCFTVPVDMISGYLSFGGASYFSVVYKGVLVALMFLVSLASRGGEKYSLVVLCFFLFFAICHFFMFGDFAVVLSGLSWLTKFLAIPVMMIYISTQKNSTDVLRRIAWSALFFLFVNSCAGLMGYGRPMYESEFDGIGSKGFIYAGNEVGTLLFCVAIILLLIESSWISISSIFFAYLIIAAILGSKTSIFSFFIIFPVYFFWMLRKKFGFISVLALCAFFGAAVVVFAYRYASIYLDVTGLSGRIEYFMDKSDWVSFLLSDRNLYASQALNYAFKKFGVLSYLFGNSGEWTYAVYGGKTSEIDPVDFFMSYGVIGLLFSLILFFIPLFKISLGVRIFGGWFGALAVLMLGSVSFTAGHVLNSGIAFSGVAGLLYLVGFYKGYRDKNI